MGHPLKSWQGRMRAMTLNQGQSVLLASGDNEQYLETFLIVTTGEEGMLLTCCG